MNLYKTERDGYIVGIGKNTGGVEISEAEYNRILSAIRNKPHATNTTDYRLKTDLTWEPYHNEPEPELDKT